VRQVLADLALSQVAHKRVEYLNISEARRLAIGIQLSKQNERLQLQPPNKKLCTQRERERERFQCTCLSGVEYVVRFQYVIAANHFHSQKETLQHKER